jgi:hypothetical protein
LNPRCRFSCGIIARETALSLSAEPAHAPLAAFLRPAAMQAGALQTRRLLPRRKFGHHYNWFERQRTNLVSDIPLLSAGKSTVTVEFAYDGGGVGKGGVATIGINGKEAGRARIENTVAGRFGMSAGYGNQSARLDMLPQPHRMRCVPCRRRALWRRLFPQVGARGGVAIVAR